MIDTVRRLIARWNYAARLDEMERLIMAETTMDAATAKALYDGLVTVQTAYSQVVNDNVALRADNARLRDEAETDAAQDQQRLQPSLDLLEQMVATVRPAVPADGQVPASQDPAEVAEQVAAAPNLPEAPADATVAGDGPDGATVTPSDVVSSSDPDQDQGTT